ncbi:head-tail connector protein [Paragemmobacter straminiformis]|uniref:PhiE125 gp8 family phage protein n=1 Tax=Paragemmobacter straminiformis TaxID=2045119 RepID=A0A842I8W0_9RHOB|nr:hypothetical protein [Gemmobacter straminiformis]MBC2835853.1 hypothetical protein [Gemmobacter straminiformis]
MRLDELTAVPDAVLPVAAFRDHLRLGTGFGTEGLQDGLLTAHLRAAVSVIEGRIGKVLVARRFRLVLEAWRGAEAQALPVAPVAALVEVALVDAAGARVVLPAGSFRLVADAHRPKLAARSGALPAVPAGGAVEVQFEAGFGADWAAVPADLAHAVLLLAAEFYEARIDDGTRGSGLPVTVQALIERWRNVRVLGGGQA